METITGVALYYADKGVVVSLPKPARHDKLMREMSELLGEPITRPNWTQGFISSEGRFLDRKFALNVARKAGQVTTLIGSVLTSEDLW